MSASIQVGDLTNSFTKGDDGRLPKVTPSTPTGSSPSIDSLSIITELSRRLNELENRIILKADGGRVLSHIAISKEAILIASDKIGVVGEVSFFDYIRDINGTATGQIDPSMTLIRGGVIQTEQIKSGNWDGTNGSYFDLDSGDILIGGLDAPRFYFENAHDAVPASLNVRGNIRVWDHGAEYGLFATGDANYTTGAGATGSGVIIGSPGIFGLNNGNVTFGFDAATGDAVFGGNKTATSPGLIFDDTLDRLTIKGEVKVEDSGSQVGIFSTGTATWDGSTAATGSGVIMGTIGVAGIKDGVINFSFEAATGNSYFKGDITGASGSFSGNIIGSGHIEINTQEPIAGFFNCEKTSTTSIGAFGLAYQYGVRGKGLGSTSTGGYFTADSGTGIVVGGKIMPPSGSSLAYDIGSSTTKFNDIWCDRVSADTGLYSALLDVTGTVTAGSKLLKSSWATGQIQISTSPTGSSPVSYYYKFI